MERFYAMVYAMGPDDQTVPIAPAIDFFQEKLVDTSARVFKAASEAGVERAVLLGSYFHHFHRERPHLRLAHRHPYIRASVDQEETVIQAVGSGMDVMILELPYILAPCPCGCPSGKRSSLTGS